MVKILEPISVFCSKKRKSLPSRLRSLKSLKINGLVKRILTSIKNVFCLDDSQKISSALLLKYKYRLQTDTAKQMAWMNEQIFALN